ncbi:MAG: hypothetical protein KBT87_14685 [Gammaproteobacteria bacterium]|nr:hypothetical protein [Gammaproteobacteria bacterium]
MKTEAKVSKIGFLLLAGLLSLVVGIFSIQMIYYGAYNPVAIQAYLALVISIYIFTNYLLSRSMANWFPILIVSSFLLGYVPYEIMIPFGIDLISSSEPQLSGLSRSFPVAIGVSVDLLFYPALYFILLLLSKKVLDCCVPLKNT